MPCFVFQSEYLMNIAICDMPTRVYSTFETQRQRLLWMGIYHTSSDIKFQIQPQSYILENVSLEHFVSALI